MRPPKFAICGVAGYNRGDDAIAVALAEGILTRVPDAEIRIAVIKPDAPRLGSARTFYCKRSRPAGLLNLARMIAGSDVIILGGGSLIQDKFGGGRVKGVLGYAWLVSRLAVLFGKPLVTAPLGVDSLRFAHSAAVAAEILDRCLQVTVRDEQSLRNARQLPVRNGTPVLQRVCDPAFSLPASDKSAGGVDAPPNAPIILAPAFEGEYDDLVIRIFAEIVRNCAASCDRPIVIIAMDDRQEEDAGKVGSIVDALPLELRDRVRVEVPADLDRAVALLRSAGAIVAMRLHAMIIGYGFTPLACLSRTTKTEAFMADFHVPGLQLTTGADPAATAEALLAGLLKWHDCERQLRKRSESLAELNDYFAGLARLAW